MFWNEGCSHSQVKDVLPEYFRSSPQEWSWQRGGPSDTSGPLAPHLNFIWENSLTLTNPPASQPILIPFALTHPAFFFILTLITTNLCVSSPLISNVSYMRTVVKTLFTSLSKAAAIGRQQSVGGGTWASVKPWSYDYIQFSDSWYLLSSRNFWTFVFGFSGSAFGGGT